MVRATKTFHFTCQACGDEVGRLEFAPKGLPLPLMVGPEGHQGDIDDASTHRAVKLLERGDPALVKRIDSDLVPYFCRSCGCWYCAKHWKTRVECEDDEPDNPYRTSIHYGVCPKNHRQELFELR